MRGWGNEEEVKGKQRARRTDVSQCLFIVTQNFTRPLYVYLTGTKSHTSTVDLQCLLTTQHQIQEQMVSVERVLFSVQARPDGKYPIFQTGDENCKVEYSTQSSLCHFYNRYISTSGQFNPQFNHSPVLLVPAQSFCGALSCFLERLWSRMIQGNHAHMPTSTAHSNAPEPNTLAAPQDEAIQLRDDLSGVSSVLQTLFSHLPPGRIADVLTEVSA